MKKLCLTMATFALLISLSACTNEPEMKSMIIAPAPISQDLKDLIDLSSADISMFDYEIDSNIKSATLQIWTCSDGNWEKTSSMNCRTDGENKRVGFRLSDEGDSVLTRSDTGHTISRSNIGVDFDEIATTGYIFSNPVTIVPDEEITLWIKLGSESDMQYDSLKDDFRQSGASTGIAVTMTFSEKEING